MSKTMMLDAIVHDPSRCCMAVPIDQRFFGRDHLRKVWPITVIMDDRKLRGFFKLHPEDRPSTLESQS